MGSVGEPIVDGLHDNTSSVDWDFDSIPQAQVVVEESQTSPSSCFHLPLGNSLRIYSVGNKWIEIQLLYCFAVAINADYSITMEAKPDDAVEDAVPDGRSLRSAAAGIRASLRRISRKSKFSVGTGLVGGGAGLVQNCGTLVAESALTNPSLRLLYHPLNQCFAIRDVLDQSHHRPTTPHAALNIARLLK